ncbi:uncharacterized protein [Palaemon carinicauda]|uniref:uncharacterized protein n=1 Tax=Palaemon carinicauda TaxID=392227 RepID=UPI0035B5CA08
MSTKESTPEKPVEGSDEVQTNLTRTQYNDQLDQHQTLLQAKNAELTRYTEMLKAVREEKEPFTKVKVTLQTEINEANKAINEKTEEVTLIKQKLRYHSVKQINENIERLEYQLRNNNFKPREEQKILDEISMLQRSTKTLKEYESKQAENKKYRMERSRLINERNDNYSKIRALKAQEDEIKKAMTDLRGVINNSKKSIDHLRQMKPALEKKWISQQPQQYAARNKRFEDKNRHRQDYFQPRDRQEIRRKLREKYDAPKEPYEEECDMCRVLIRYLQSSMNVHTLSTPANARLTPLTTASAPCTPASDPGDDGSFYMKPKDEDGFTRVSKRERAKAKREHRLSKRVKELPHTPDVLFKFTKLSVSPPKNTDEIPGAVIALQDSLQRYHQLYLEGQKNYGKVKDNRSNEGENAKFMRPTSLALTPPQVVITTVPTATATPGASSSSFLVSESISSPLNLERNLQNDNPTSFPMQAAALAQDKNRSSTTTLPSRPLKTETDIVLSPSVQNEPLGDPCVSNVSQNGQFLYKPNPSSNVSVTSQPPTWAAVATKTLSSPQSTTALREVATKTLSSPQSTTALREVATKTLSSPQSTTALRKKQAVVQPEQHLEVLCNGTSPSECLGEPYSPLSFPTLANQRRETNVCNGMLSLRGNKSFFPAHVPYPSNLDEVNNNTTQSYANVTAKMKI